MDTGTVLLYGLPATAVLFIIVFKFIFSANENGRKYNYDESPAKSSNKKEKKNTKVQRKKIETPSVPQTKNSAESKTSKKSKVVEKPVAKVVEKPVAKVVEKPVGKVVEKPVAKKVVEKTAKAKKEEKKAAPAKQPTKKAEKKTVQNKQDEDFNDDSWTTVTKKPRVTQKSAANVGGIACPISSLPSVDLQNEKATLTVEQVMTLHKTGVDPKVESVPKALPVKQETKKVEVEKKKKIPKLVPASIEDQIEAAMEDTEFETVKSRNRKNRKSVEDAKSNRAPMLSPPSYEESLNQIAQEKAASVTFDEMGSLEVNNSQTKVKPARKKKSRRD